MASRMRASVRAHAHTLTQPCSLPSPIMTSVQSEAASLGGGGEEGGCGGAEADGLGLGGPKRNLQPPAK